MQLRVDRQTASQGNLLLIPVLLDPAQDTLSRVMYTAPSSFNDKAKTKAKVPLRGLQITPEWPSIAGPYCLECRVYDTLGYRLLFLERPTTLRHKTLPHRTVPAGWWFVAFQQDEPPDAVSGGNGWQWVVWPSIMTGCPDLWVAKSPRPIDGNSNSDQCDCDCTCPSGITKLKWTSEPDDTPRH